MQVVLIRWCLDPKGRTPISVDPNRVDATEHFSDAWKRIDTGEDMPAATRIIMKNKQEYTVQGSVHWVVALLNGTEG